jgi:hypothetical protein
MPILSDPFDETKILVNTVIDKIELDYLLMELEQFSTQLEKIEKDIRLLALCLKKMPENPEKVRRVNCIRGLEQRVVNIKTLFTNRKVKTRQSATTTFPTNSTTYSDTSTQQLLMASMIDEQDKQLELIDRSVGILKQKAQTIGDEITSQNIVLDEISIKIEETDTRLNFATKSIGRLSKKLKNSCWCKTVMIIVAILIIFVVVLICILQ